MGSLNEDLHVNGHLTAKTMSLPAGSVKSAAIDPDGLPATDIQKPQLLTYFKVGTAATETVFIYECRGATGTVQWIRFGSYVLNIGAAAVTIDLQKSTGGGAFATILSSVITLDTGNTARVSEAGVISNTALVQGDLLQLVITATAGGGTLATGLFGQVEVFEDQP